MWTATFFEEDGASMMLLIGSPCRRREDRVGTLSESSCPSDQFQMTLMQQNQLFQAELFKNKFERRQRQGGQVMYTVCPDDFIISMLYYILFYIIMIIYYIIITI